MTLKEVAMEYYQRALVARDSAERSHCPETSTHCSNLNNCGFPRLSGTTIMRLSTTRR
jgi:hypothetical protein